ncbi:male-enhanced antigen 1 isoform X2 [Periplaneta americana]
MVGMWTPEPPREPCNENLSTAGAGIVVVEQESSDSEDEIAAYSGYELLPQIPIEPPDSGSEDVDDAVSGGEPPGLPGSDNMMAAGADVIDTGASVIDADQCNFEVERQAELREVWSGASSGNNIEMGSEQAEQVRAAMANFALPASAIPAWASAVPEEQWKQQLLDRIQRLQQRQGDEQTKT